MNDFVVFARWRQCAPLFNTCFFRPIWVHILNGIRIGSAVFAQLMAVKVPILYNGPPPFPSKLGFALGIWTLSIAWFLGPTRFHKQNSISMGSYVSAGLRIVTDRPTDRPRYSVCNNRPHIYVVLRCGLKYVLRRSLQPESVRQLVSRSTQISWDGKMSINFWAE